MSSRREYVAHASGLQDGLQEIWARISQKKCVTAQQKECENSINLQSNFEFCTLLIRDLFLITLVQRTPGVLCVFFYIYVKEMFSPLLQTEHTPVGFIKF